MGKIAPARIVLLALMLAVSHVALISHVTAHFAPNLEQCELCVSQSQLQAAIPSADQSVPVSLEPADIQLISTRGEVSSQPFNSNRQRAPPTASS